MPYCSLCGVEVDYSIDNCPLCSALIQKINEPDIKHDSPYPETKPLPRMSKKQKLFLIWFPLIIAASASFLIVLCIDLFKNHSITWSRYPMTAIGSGILYLTGAFIFSQSFLLLYSWLNIVTGVLLLLLDVFEGSPRWFPQLGLPLLSVVYLYGISVFILFNSLKKRISLFVSLNFILIALFCAAVDLIITGYFSFFHLTWSPIAVIVFLAFSFLGFYYVLFLRKHVDLQKYFHY